MTHVRIYLLRCMQFHAQQGGRGLPPVDLASSVLETLSRSSDPGELQVSTRVVGYKMGVNCHSENLENVDGCSNPPKNTRTPCGRRPCNFAFTQKPFYF